MQGARLLIADPGILIDADNTSAYGSHNETEFTGCCSILGGCLCGCLVKGDCCKDEGYLQEENDDEDALFCTLCNAEVRKFSKHCRSRDKCVDGFDHHRQGLTTYEYVVIMRTQNEPLEPSQDGGDQQSLPSSPTSSAVTAISGRS